MVAELIMVSRRKGERVQGDIIMEGRKGEGWSAAPSFLPFLYSTRERATVGAGKNSVTEMEERKLMTKRGREREVERKGGEV